MKFKQFLFAAFIAAFAGMAMVGCNENDPNDPDPGDGVNPVTNLEAVTLSSTSVGLRWTASTTSGVDEYRITVRTPAGDTATTATATGTNVSISNLTAGTIYTFGVVAVDTDLVSSDDESTEATILWSPALRFNQQASPASTLRLYPKSVSTKGSGILVTSTGARNASANISNTDRFDLQILADIANDGTGFVIGAPTATEFGPSGSNYSAYNDFDDDVQVSDNYLEIDSLNGWYNDASLATYFSGTGSANAFSFGDKLASGKGVGFVVRWPSTSGGSTYHYARVFVVPTSTGELVHTDVATNDPYIEVRISYQDFAGVPYAKGN